MSPDTVVANIQGIAEEVAAEGLTVAAYLRAAIKQPPLFYQKPATIARHITLICAMYDDGIFTLPQRRVSRSIMTYIPVHTRPVIAFLLRYPILLTRSDSNLTLCRICVEMSVIPPGSRALFRPRHELERELMKSFGHIDPSCQLARMRTMFSAGLISDGYIKSAKLVCNGMLGTLQAICLAEVDPLRAFMPEDRGIR